MSATLAYLKRRLDERATWLMIGAGITAGAALAWPWSLISVIAATIGALVPDGTATK